MLVVSWILVNTAYAWSAGLWPVGLVIVVKCHVRISAYACGHCGCGLGVWGWHLCGLGGEVPQTTEGHHCCPT